MRTVFVTYDSEKDVGGVSSWLQRLLPRLKASGMDVEVHVFGFGGRPGINCASFEKQGIPFRWRPWEDDTRKAVRSCLKLIEQSQPDVYVPNCIIPAYYAAGYVRRQGVKTVGVLHSDDPFYWGIVDEFINGTDDFRLSAVVSVSKFLQEAVEESAQKYNLATRCIGCGVPLTNEIAQQSSGVFRLVYAGRLEEEQKCISEVTRAFCSIAKQNLRVEAWIVGEGSARANIEGIIRTSGVDPERVKLIGRVDVTNIYSVLRQCHAFVLLSDYEGLPVSVMEAMAVGLVPICLDIRSGIREVVKPGFNGMIVKNRTEDFYTAVQALEGDAALWSRLSTNARETIGQKFSEEACTVSWIQLLRSFGKSDHVRAIKAPVFVKLPRRNPKFGSYDQRPLLFGKNARQLRTKLGSYKRALQKLSRGKFNE